VKLAPRALARIEAGTWECAVEDRFCCPICQQPCSPPRPAPLLAHCRPCEMMKRDFLHQPQRLKRTLWQDLAVPSKSCVHVDHALE
jgi:hypothetical protein